MKPMPNKMAAIMAPAKRFLKAIRLPSSAVTNANAVIKPTNSQLMVERSRAPIIAFSRCAGKRNHLPQHSLAEPHAARQLATHKLNGYKDPLVLLFPALLRFP